VQEALHPNGLICPTCTKAPSETKRHFPELSNLAPLRAWARAFLFAAGEYELAEAVDPLQAFAVASGLVAQIGADAVQQIIAQQFRERLRL
jgi:hypothetical protein